MDFLQRLRELNVERSEDKFFPLERWNVLEWAGAAAGEMGEAANVAKKINRAETMGLSPDPYWQQQLGDEIADVVTYLDLLCARQGIDLQAAIARKFNIVSERVGYDRELE
jgi:NTP pyrophosphatase (non-canonical NTP hydrolase)